MPCSREENNLKSNVINKKYIEKIEANKNKSVATLNLYKSLKINSYAEKKNFLENEVLKKIISEFGRLKFGNNTNTEKIILIANACVENRLFSTTITQKIAGSLVGKKELDKLHHYILIGLTELLNPDKEASQKNIQLIILSFNTLVKHNFEDAILELTYWEDEEREALFFERNEKESDAFTREIDEILREADIVLNRDYVA